MVVVQPDDAVEFVLRRTPVTLVALVDEVQPAQSDAGEVDLLHRDLDAVHGGSVHEDGGDIADVHSDGGGTGTKLGALLGVGDDPLPREPIQPFAAEIGLQLLGAIGLATE